ncbi:RNA polymerase sigma factor, partial [Candidatus Omnitrophota bacterium]
GDSAWKILDAIPAKTKDAAEAMSSEELSNILKGALSSLNKKEKAIMKLHLFFEKDYRDISKMLSIPGGTVSSYIKRSKNRLRDILRKNL